jgi:dTDP-4-amino-4,6-dideoxygalactose transaminase
MQRVKAAYPDLPHPGHAMTHCKPWLFPTLSPEPERLMKHLWRHGFDATRGSSNLVCAPALEGRPAPRYAEQLMKEVLYLPLHPAATPAELDRMADVLLKFAAPYVSHSIVDTIAFDGIVCGDIDRSQAPPKETKRGIHEAVH